MEIQYTEEDLRKAYEEAVRTRRLRKVARKWNIPPSTLYNRLYSLLPRKVTYQDE